MIGKTLVVLLASLALTAAIVCNCSIVRCAQPSKDECVKKGMDFQPKGGYCGCCDLCTNYSRIDEPCGTIVKPVPVRGGPPPEKKNCEPGLVCVDGICRKPQDCN
ncbi:uncharacterized protein [Halyomorpha halys]|uniref:uncharacterized protein n=1 Tax=Halyomorpha halys TaxID=286706 RepID=UPI0006D5143E|nr:uncharacterized protein LOC106687108 [Halyomorpha halys]